MAERLVAGLPISLSTKVTACVRRFETATALNDGSTEARKEISMFGPLGSVIKSYWALANGQDHYLFKEVKCYKVLNTGEDTWGGGNGQRTKEYKELIESVS
jgi:hypothetical protein